MNMQLDEKVRSRVIAEAAEWLARMHEKDLSDIETNEWKCWLNQSAEHQRVWSHAEHLLGKFGSLDPKLGMPVLNRNREAVSRRALIRAIVALMTIPSVVWFGWQFYPPHRANVYRTATGEQREIVLDDQTLITINTATELSIKYDELQRLVEHRTGEVFVKTALDTYPVSRPFVVETACGRMRALGTEFIVKQVGPSTSLSVIDGAVEVITRRTQSKLIVNAGHQVSFTDSSLGAVVTVRAGLDGWRTGVLYAQAMRLADFIEDLSRYRAGVLRCDPAVVDLRVTGVFRLADTDTILRLLADTLPVRIDQRTRYWVTVYPR